MPMLLLVDENVPKSVADYLRERGHQVELVTELLLPGTQDLVVAKIGDRMSAVVVTWDRDFEQLISRVPQGNRNRFRRLGRISFKCEASKGRPLLEKWIRAIERHYDDCLEQPDFRMLVVISDSGIKLS